MIALDHLQQKQLAAKPPKGQPVTDSHDTVCFAPADVRLHTDLCLVTGHSVEMTEAAFSMKIHVSSTVSQSLYILMECTCSLTENNAFLIKGWRNGLHPDAVESQYSVTLGNNSLCQRMKQCSVYT